MTTFSELFGGESVKVAVKIQTGTVQLTLPGTGGGYVDVAISAVVASRCVLHTEGGAANNDGTVAAISRMWGGSTTIRTGLVHISLVNATTLRIGSPYGNNSSINVRWTIVEYL